MATIERTDIERALARKGFRLETGHHRFYRLYVEGKKTEILTKVSTGKKYKTLGNELVKRMAHQMHLTSRQLHDFVECSMSLDGYVEALRALGKV